MHEQGIVLEMPNGFDMTALGTEGARPSTAGECAAEQARDSSSVQPPAFRCGSKGVDQTIKQGAEPTAELRVQERCRRCDLPFLLEDSNFCRKCGAQRCGKGSHEASPDNVFMQVTASFEEQLAELAAEQAKTEEDLLAKLREASERSVKLEQQLESAHIQTEALLTMASTVAVDGQCWGGQQMRADLKPFWADWLAGTAQELRQLLAKQDAETRTGSPVFSAASTSMGNSSNSSSNCNSAVSSPEQPSASYATEVAAPVPEFPPMFAPPGLAPAAATRSPLVGTDSKTRCARLDNTMKQTLNLFDALGAQSQHSARRLRSSSRSEADDTEPRPPCAYPSPMPSPVLRPTQPPVLRPSVCRRDRANTYPSDMTQRERSPHVQPPGTPPMRPAAALNGHVEPPKTPPVRLELAERVLPKSPALHASPKEKPRRRSSSKQSPEMRGAWSLLGSPILAKSPAPYVSQHARTLGMSSPNSLGMLSPSTQKLIIQNSKAYKNAMRSPAGITLGSQSPALSPSPFVIYEDGGTTFTFSCRKAEGVELGLGLETDFVENGDALRVLAVKPKGAIEAWNAQCVGGPAAGKAVCVGDCIVGVNGETTVDKMMEEVQSKQLVKLTIHRKPPAEEDGDDSAAHGPITPPGKAGAPQDSAHVAVDTTKFFSAAYPPPPNMGSLFSGAYLPPPITSDDLTFLSGLPFLQLPPAAGGTWSAAAAATPDEF